MKSRFGKAAPAGSSEVEGEFARVAAPIIDKMLESEVARGTVSPADAEELAAELALRLVRRLTHLYAEKGAEPLGHDYVRTTVRHALDDHRKRNDPLRSRLDGRVRYVLTHTSALALWDHESPLCGLAKWSGRTDTVPVAPISASGAALEDARALRDVLRDTLARSGGPVELYELVHRLADALGLAAAPFVSVATLDETPVEAEAPARLEGAAYLTELWREISELPVRQRRALLLQMRVDDGESVARLLASTGIASMRAQAHVLELSIPEFTALWNELPLDDARIAKMLDATRQQVINLRRSARERLVRRVGRAR